MLSNDKKIAQPKQAIEEIAGDRAMNWSKRVFLPMSGVSASGAFSEYDPQGLAKRVAYAFDRHPYIRQIDTLCILQNGSLISLLGKVESIHQLAQIIEYAQQVEGVKDVDTSQVVVESGPIALVNVIATVPTLSEVG
jgi:hypothetical protein